MNQELTQVKNVYVTLSSDNAEELKATKNLVNNIWEMYRAVHLYNTWDKAEASKEELVRKIMLSKGADLKQATSAVEHHISDLGNQFFNAVELAHRSIHPELYKEEPKPLEN